MPNDPTDFDFVLDAQVPDGGVYASDVSAWHTQHEFTVDFLTHWTHPSRGADSQIIVARVKIPPTAMFGIVQKLSNGVGEYEAEQGPITPPPTEAS